MGSPYVGETMQFLSPRKSPGIPNFIKERMRKYGSLFRTSLVGGPVIVSSDPDFIYFLLQQEGKLVERWFMGSFAKLLLIKKLHQSFQNMAPLHKYLRNLVLASFGPSPPKISCGHS